MLSAIKHEIKENIAISLPLIASQLIFSSSGFIGTAMVAHLGQDALAASVLVTMTWMTLCVLFFGILNAVSVLVSHQFGAKNYASISKIMGQSFILGVILTSIMIMLMFLTPFFLQYTPQPPAVLEIAAQYMHALIWVMPGLTTLIICEQFLAGTNRAKLVLRISLLVVPIEIPLIYLLVFGKFGFPQCGVAGIGYGLAMTYTTAAICLSFYLYKSKQFKIFGVFDNIRKIDVEKLNELMHVGLPMGCMHVIEVGAFMMATFWVARFGTTMLAAHQIVLQYLNIGITVVFAMSQAITVRVGHAVGEQNLSGVQRAIYVGMTINFIYILIVALAFIFFPHFFLSLDINIHDTANLLLIQDASILLGISGILMIFDNFRIIGFGALRGLKDTKFPMYSSFISFWLVGLSLAYLFGVFFQLSGKGIWSGLTIGIAIGAFIVFLRIQWLLKRVDVKKLLNQS